MKDWNEMTREEKIASFPKRHPYTFRVVLWLYIEYGFKWEVVDPIMRAMGFQLLDVRQEFGAFSIGAPTYASPDEPSNSAESFYDGE